MTHVIRYSRKGEQFTLHTDVGDSDKLTEVHESQFYRLCDAVEEVNLYFDRLVIDMEKVDASV